MHVYTHNMFMYEYVSHTALWI